MTSIKRHLPTIRAVVIGLFALLLVLLLWTARANTPERTEDRSNSAVQTSLKPQRTAAAVRPLAVAARAIPQKSAQNDLSLLNVYRQFALGMIETGNNDRAVGRAGEVSRYQIMPSVWKRYSSTLDYRNPEVSTEVARQHWVYLHNYFKKKTQREPTDFDMYVLWNTHYGYYARKGFDPRRVHRVVRDRAQRFCNLVDLPANRAVESMDGKRA